MSKLTFNWVKHGDLVCMKIEQQMALDRYIKGLKDTIKALGGKDVGETVLHQVTTPSYDPEHVLAGGGGGAGPPPARPGTPNTPHSRRSRRRTKKKSKRRRRSRIKR